MCLSIIAGLLSAHQWLHEALDNVSRVNRRKGQHCMAERRCFCKVVQQQSHYIVNSPIQAAK